MVNCPHCQKILDIDELNQVMDYLSQFKLEGSTSFEPSCCRQEIEAFSDLGRYYIKNESAPHGQVLIGAA